MESESLSVFMCPVILSVLRSKTTTSPASPSLMNPRPSSGTMATPWSRFKRSEEHTSELQSLRHLVCRLLLEKKKYKNAVRRHKRKHTETLSTTDSSHVS